MALELFKRHIVTDHINKIIYLQVMVDYHGNVKADEYKKIDAGVFWEFIPRELVDTFRHGIASGYTVRPMALNMMSNDVCTVIQINGFLEAFEKPTFSQHH